MQIFFGYTDIKERLLECVNAARAANRQVNRFLKHGGYRALNMRTCAPNEPSVRAACECVRASEHSRG